MFLVPGFYENNFKYYKKQFESPGILYKNKKSVTVMKAVTFKY